MKINYSRTETRKAFSQLCPGDCFKFIELDHFCMKIFNEYSDYDYYVNLVNGKTNRIKPEVLVYIVDAEITIK